MSSRTPPRSPRTPNRPKDDDFTQQRLPAWRPVVSPTALAAVMGVITVVFIPLGIVALNASASVIEVIARYDNIESCVLGAKDNDAAAEVLYAAGGEGTNCSIELEVQNTMEPPIYVYYELHNFYQNHRRYVRSRSDAQLRGESGTGTSLDETLGMPNAGYLDTCAPQQYAPGKAADDSDAVIDPCGMVAWTYFNDTFKFARRTLTVDDSGSRAEVHLPIPIDETGISWETDRNERYGHYQAENFNDQPEYRGGGTIKGYIDQDEHFLVWMRTAMLPKFRKLWGRIDTKLYAGDVLQMEVANRYNTYLFDGEKHIVLGTTSWLGGKNRLAGALLVFLGCITATFCGLFIWIHLDPNTREFGDMRYLSWNRDKGGAFIVPGRGPSKKVMEIVLPER